MDLYAYANISRLENVMKANGIEVPRLRGLRLMGEEECVTKETCDETFKCQAYRITKSLCRSNPFWNHKSCCESYNSWTNYLVKYYLKDGEIRWDRIHGWKRRVLKFEIKKAKRRIKAEYDMFNKYAGRDDILYIHARIGGNNWKYFDGDNVVAKKTWFLEKVDDAFDSTYCDIYAKIDPETLKILEKEEENE